MVRCLVIVNRSNVRLYETLEQQFVRDDHVTVILDRRRRRRRDRPQMRYIDRRQVDRRKSVISDELHTAGFAVTLPEGSAPAGPEIAALGARVSALEPRK